MNKILQTLKARNAQKKATMLVTIITEAGSAPRGAGANMLVGEEGLAAGTIGGGMLEFTAIKEAQKFLAKGQGARVTYDLNKNGAGDLGMICGGQVELLYTYVEANAENAKIISKAKTALTQRKNSWLILPYSGQGLDITVDEKPTADSAYIYKLPIPSKVFIFGGGHLGQEIVPLLVHLDFTCIVTDDRAEFSRPELFFGAETVHTRSFDELIGHYDVRPQDYIIAVTRGHIGDLAVEKFALNTQAYYIGVVGSRAKIAAVNAKLLAAGFTPQDLARITAPIGLDIGSETPAEIAISIAAQLIQVRAKV